VLLAVRGGHLASLGFLGPAGPAHVLAGLKDIWHPAPFLEAPGLLEPLRRFLVDAMGGPVPPFQASPWADLALRPRPAGAIFP
jgi:hypothetical protein